MPTGKCKFCKKIVRGLWQWNLICLIPMGVVIYMIKDYLPEWLVYVLGFIAFLVPQYFMPLYVDKDE